MIKATQNKYSGTNSGLFYNLQTWKINATFVMEVELAYFWWNEPLRVFYLTRLWGVRS